MGNRLQPGRRSLAVAIEKKTDDQTQTDLDDAVAQRLAQFQREVFERANQPMQLVALCSLVAAKSREVVVNVRTDDREVIEPLRRRRRTRLDEVADALNHVGDIVREAAAYDDEWG